MAAVDFVRGLCIQIKCLFSKITWAMCVHTFVLLSATCLGSYLVYQSNSPAYKEWLLGAMVASGIVGFISCLLAYAIVICSIRYVKYTVKLGESGECEE